MVVVASRVRSVETGMHGRTETMDEPLVTYGVARFLHGGQWSTIRNKPDFRSDRVAQHTSPVQPTPNRDEATDNSEAGFDGRDWYLVLGAAVAGVVRALSSGSLGSAH